MSTIYTNQWQLMLAALEKRNQLLEEQNQLLKEQAQHQAFRNQLLEDQGQDQDFSFQLLQEVLELVAKRLDNHTRTMIRIAEIQYPDSAPKITQDLDRDHL